MSNNTPQKYCIYKSDPTMTDFTWVDNAETEEGGRKSISGYLQATVLMEGFKKNKFISLFLYKGKDNITGKLILSVKLNNKNY